jgi:hypothetical protein
MMTDVTTIKPRSTCVSKKQEKEWSKDVREKWKNSISGDEVIKRVHKHIEDWYAAGGKRGTIY